MQNQVETVITKDDWTEWDQSPVTKFIRDDLLARRNLYASKLLAAVGDTVDEIGAQAIQNRSRIAAYNGLLEIHMDEVIPEEDEVEDD